MSLENPCIQHENPRIQLTIFHLSRLGVTKKITLWRFVHKVANLTLSIDFVETFDNRIGVLSLQWALLFHQNQISDGDVGNDALSAVRQ